MRADRYLWSVGLFKTRGLAAEALKKGKVTMDEVRIKASRVMSPGAQFQITYLGYKRQFKVLALPVSRVGAKLVPDLLVETTAQSELDRRDQLAAAKGFGSHRVVGRPTKKDRRDIEDFMS